MTASGSPVPPCPGGARGSGAVAGAVAGAGVPSAPAAVAGHGRDGVGLRRFREPVESRGPVAEVCEMCAEPLGERHGHAVDTGTRALLCVCVACRLLLSRGGTVARGRYQAVPERYLYLPRMRLSAADWEELQIPVRTAFLFHNSALGRFAAFYPSPGGATESLLDLSTWERVLAANPELPPAEPDVEAYLIDRRPDGFACHLVPIDACYELVGLVRVHWKGFHGGQEAQETIAAFFDGLRRRAETIPADAQGDAVSTDAVSMDPPPADDSAEAAPVAAAPVDAAPVDPPSGAGRGGAPVAAAREEGRGRD
ncbi:DUF5947 family protein [Sphaerisporangium sp. NPDC005289]|uniref:DUF5947 family protein n=1 Tax=Sphaerisporangium sp. NPDC005289 TaxID=3155247 RepID=UPI0033A41F67